MATYYSQQYVAAHQEPRTLASQSPTTRIFRGKYTTVAGISAAETIGMFKIPAGYMAYLTTITTSAQVGSATTNLDLGYTDGVTPAVAGFQDDVTVSGAGPTASTAVASVDAFAAEVECIVTIAALVGTISAGIDIEVTVHCVRVVDEG